MNFNNIIHNMKHISTLFKSKFKTYIKSEIFSFEN